MVPAFCTQTDYTPISHLIPLHALSDHINISHVVPAIWTQTNYTPISHLIPHHTLSDHKNFSHVIPAHCISHILHFTYLESMGWADQLDSQSTNALIFLHLPFCDMWLLLILIWTGDGKGCCEVLSPYDWWYCNEAKETFKCGTGKLQAADIKTHQNNHKVRRVKKQNISSGKMQTMINQIFEKL